MTDTELARRLEKLERDNRRLKRLSGAGLALIVTAAVAYAVSCSSTPKTVDIRSSSGKITAREFDVVDSSGKVRAQIAVNCTAAAGCQPQIQLFDQNGQPRTSISAGKLTVSGGKEEASLLGGHLQFRAGPKGGSPRVTAELGSGSAGGGLLSLSGSGTSSIRVDSNSPGVEIEDSQGYIMNLGAVDLTTVNSGQTSPTTADSIVMFANDKEHHLIWRVP
ncbi:MAG: hypothetical protein P8Z30_10940 [Acidobacteriota bacterium]